MAIGDKAEHKAEEFAGKVKQAAGKVTGNEDLEASGFAEEEKAKLKQGVDEAHDAAEHAKDEIKDRLDDK
ncbi:MAG: CsbD family protein [Microbacterium sp.]|nr:CsbD family protein [Microbacterium sp.]